MSYRVLERGSTSMKIQLAGASGSTYNVKVNNVTKSNLSYKAIVTFTGLVPDRNYTVYVYKKAQTFYRVVIRSRNNSTPLSLAEVQVWDHNNNLISRDLSLRKSVTQTNTVYSGVASRAVDGKTDGRWGQKSVTHTDGKRWTYWVLEFNQQVSIKKVKIYNRTDCCGDRLSGARLMLDRAAGQTIYTKTLNGNNTQEYTFPA